MYLSTDDGMQTNGVALNPNKAMVKKAERMKRP